MASKAGALPYEPRRFPLAGAVDADGHICEPANLWEEYLEAKWKPRALRIRKDADGLEYLECDGAPVSWTAKGMVSMFHAMGDLDVAPSPERTWTGTMPYGGGNAAERVDLMDRENLEHALLYPTLSLCWEPKSKDPELTLACVRAYNRWIADFCRGTKGRLVPIAQLSLLDPIGSAKELERAVKDGCRGAFVGMGSPTKRPHGDPAHDPIFAKCQELDVPFAMHPSFNPGEYLMPRYDIDPWDPQYVFAVDTLFFQMLQQAFVFFFQFGVFEKFPRLRVGVLEAGAGWIAAFLDRMDALHEHPWYKSQHLKEKPSAYFRRQCFISGDPDEESMSLVMDAVGPECFVWGSDYPHPDHTGSWVPELLELAERVSPKTRDLVIGANVKRIYKL